MSMSPPDVFTQRPASGAVDLGDQVAREIVDMVDGVRASDGTDSEQALGGIG
jgi:hypothetical protein